MTFMAKDLVCGMEVDEKKVTQKTFYKGQTYFFCSAACKKEFDKDPGKYIKEKEVKK